MRPHIAGSTARPSGRVVAVSLLIASIIAAGCSGSSDDADGATDASSAPIGSEPADTAAPTAPPTEPSTAPPTEPAPEPAPQVSVSREWLTQIGAADADVMLGLAARPDGGVWSTGHTDGPFAPGAAGGQDQLVVGVDAAGAIGAVVQIGSPSTDSLLGAGVAPGGGVYAVGYTEGDFKQPNAGVNDIVLTHFDASLTEQWSLQLGGVDWDRGFGVVGFDGGAYIGGYTFGGFADALGGTGAAGGHDAVIVRVSDAGVVEWVRQFGSDGVDWGQSIAVTADGAAVITGYTQGSLAADNAGGRDMWVARIEADGTDGWSTQLGSDAEDWTQGIVVAPDGDIVVVGLTEGVLAEGATAQGVNDVLVVRLAADGTVRWIRQFGTEGEDKAFSVAVSADGSLVVGGYSTGWLPSALGVDGANAGGKDAYLAVLSADGDLLAIEQFGTAGDDETYAVVATADGAIAANGVTEGQLGDTPAGGKFDGWVARFTIAVG